MALRWTRNRAVAEDIVQETLLRTWQSRQRIRDNARAWFFKILWNVFLTHQKRISLNREVGLETNHAPWSTDERYQIVDDQDEISRLLVTLSDLDRQLLSLRYGEDFTVKEIAQMTGLPVGTVKSRIHRSLKHLRKFLRHAFDEDAETVAEANHRVRPRHIKRTEDSR